MAGKLSAEGEDVGSSRTPEVGVLSTATLNGAARVEADRPICGELLPTLAADCGRELLRCNGEAARMVGLGAASLNDPDELTPPEVFGRKFWPPTREVSISKDIETSASPRRPDDHWDDDRGAGDGASLGAKSPDPLRFRA
jgi:hypothetical protein